MFLPLDKRFLSRGRSTPVLVACLCREQCKELWEPVPALKVWQRKHELVLLVDLAVGINSKTVSKNFYSFIPCFRDSKIYQYILMVPRGSSGKLAFSSWSVGLRQSGEMLWVLFLIKG